MTLPNTLSSSSRASSRWHKLPLALTELRIDTTLQCGQSFRWKKVEDQWICALRGRVIVLRQDEAALYYKTIFSALPGRARLIEEDDDTEKMLFHYFNLKHNLESLYEQWSHVDPIFRKLAPQFGGVRILNQDAFEALICFICSSNNNISRISSMAYKLCKHYGSLIATIGEEQFYDFPTPEALSMPTVEGHLRQLGFGYRARYIASTVKMILDKPPDWLNSLRNPESPAWSWNSAPSSHITYKKAHDQLVGLPGVGPKVADCVCLMGLGWSEAVPIDTHVWQIAQRDYKFGEGKGKTFTKATYNAVGSHFRHIWGKQAGWAHSVLFTADLKAFAKEKEAAYKRNNKKREVHSSFDSHSTLSSAHKTELALEIPSELSIISRGKRKKISSIPIEMEEHASVPSQYALRSMSQKRAKSEA